MKHTSLLSPIALVSVASCLLIGHGVAQQTPDSAAVPASSQTPPSAQAPPPAEGSDSSVRWSQRLINTLTAPTTFESPTITTELRPIFIYQKLPGTSAFGGGDFLVYALQARYALTERLALIATKDGYVDWNPNMGPNETGFANVTAGAKYAFLDLPDTGILATGGVTYEFPVGSSRVFQGEGDGILRFFSSGGWDLERLNLVGSVAWNQPIDTDANSTSFDYHVHASFAVTPWLFPLAEVNGITYVGNGNQVSANFEGGDLINLGSNNVAGQTVITGALGARVELNDGHISLGAAYEVPLTCREDLFASRVTADVIFRF